MPDSFSEVQRYVSKFIGIESMDELIKYAFLAGYENGYYDGENGNEPS